MPRSSTFLAAAAAAVPLSAGLAAVLAPAAVAGRVSLATPALLATSAAPAARAPLASALAATTLARPTPGVAGAAALTPAARAAATARLALGPAVQLPLDVERRRRAYLELVATDDQLGGPGARGLADVLAWMEVGVRPTLRDAFGPTPFDRVRAKVEAGCRALDARSDDHPPDFDANDLLRLLYLYPAVPYVAATPTVAGAPATTPAATAASTAAVGTPAVAARPRASAALARAATLARAALLPPPPPPPRNRLPRDVAGRIQAALLNWKYWLDEPGWDDQVYWSENHVILFATAEYLAGQLLPDAWFPNAGLRGREHQAKARPRLLRWLDERLKFGFSEWNSPGYYEEDLKALLNLVDFCDDAVVRRRAAMVLDLLVFDLARLTNGGSFGVTAGRCYEKLGGDGSRWKSDGTRQSVGELIEVLFGTRGGHHHAGAVSALYFGTSRHRVPTVLLAIGQDRPRGLVDRARVSLDFAEAPAWGIGFDGLDDGVFWWSKGAYMAKHTIATTRALIRRHGVARLRGGIQDALGFAYGAFEAASDGALRAAADAASPVTEGMCLTKANLYTYREPEVMLSSVQDYRRGQIGPQQHPWQATLGMKAVVFTTLPGKREGDGPGYWTGNAALPSIVQHQDALICAYDAPLITRVSEGLHRTHAWFPVAELDETDRRRGSNLHGAWGVTRAGTWLFGRKGDGYVAIYSNEGWSGGPVDFVAAGSWTNVFVVQVGTAARFGSFQAFKDRVTAARIYVKYPTVLDGAFYCGYDAPDRGRLELHYGGTPRLNGQPYPVDAFPRYDNPYCQLPWGGDDLTIRHAGLALRHVRDGAAQDPRGDVRRGDGL